MAIYNFPFIRESIEKSICFEDDTTVYLKEYVEAFRELAKLFHNINVAWHMVGMNIDSSCEVLENLMNSNPEIKTVANVLEHENNDPDGPAIQSVLWLHRPLEIILELFRELIPLEDDAAVTADHARKAYDITLSKYHNWFAQKLSCLLISTLPKFGDFRRMSVGDMPNEGFQTVMQQAQSFGLVVYDRVDKYLSQIPFTN